MPQFDDTWWWSGDRHPIEEVHMGRDFDDMDYDDQDYGHDDYDECDFADPGGESALRRETPDNPRNLPCPTCHWPNMLTPADRARGYQCDSCANAMERGGEINYYEGDDDEAGY